MTQSNSMALPQVGMVFGVSADTGALRPLQSVAPANPARCFWNRSWARASVCTCATVASLVPQCAWMFRLDPNRRTKATAPIGTDASSSLAAPGQWRTKHCSVSVTLMQADAIRAWRPVVM